MVHTFNTGAVEAEAGGSMLLSTVSSSTARALERDPVSKKQKAKKTPKTKTKSTKLS